MSRDPFRLAKLPSPSLCAAIEMIHEDCPHQVEFRDQNGTVHVTEASRWCLEQFGPPRIHPGRCDEGALNEAGRWYNIGYCFRFMVEEEAIWFRFRWG